MAINLPPFPANATPGGFVWTDWWKKFQQYVQEVTEVVGQDASPIFGTVPGVASLGDCNWIAVANFVKFNINWTFDEDGEVWAGQFVDIGSSSHPMPAPIYDSAIEVVAFQNNPTPTVHNIGVGSISYEGGLYGPVIALPDATIPPGFDTIIVQGWYFIS